jgi:hypothetical protein
LIFVEIRWRHGLARFARVGISTANPFGFLICLHTQQGPETTLLQPILAAARNPTPSASLRADYFAKSARECAIRGWRGSGDHKQTADSSLVLAALRLRTARNGRMKGTLWEVPLVSSLRDSVAKFWPYPGLTSGATIFRPSGAGVAGAVGSRLEGGGAAAAGEIPSPNPGSASVRHYPNSKGLLS